VAEKLAQLKKLLTTNNFLFIIFISLVTYKISSSYYNDLLVGGSGWKTGDWLINYSSGFTRRGAVGELCIFIAQLFGFNLLYTVASLQFAVFFICITAISLIYFKSDRSNFSMWLLTSPAFIGFYLYEPDASFRKELLLYFSFIFRLSLLEIAFNGFFLILLSSLIYIFALLSHELSFFYLPFFLSISFLSFYSAKTTKLDFLIESSFLIISSFISLVLIYLNNGVGSANSICNVLLKHSIKPHICDGAISWLDNQASFAFETVKNNILSNEYVFTYTLAVTLASIPWSFLKETKESYYLKCFAISAFIFSLPLYLLAIDWGRWIAIYFFHLTLLTLYLIKYKIVSFNEKFINKRLIIAYATLWSIPSYLGGGIKFGLGRYFSLILKWLIG
jgi:hypothetical protein